MASTASLELPALIGVLLMLALNVSRLGAAPALNLDDAATAQRLRQMFDRGQRQAINDFYEQKALKVITNANSSHEHHHSEPATRFIPISLVNPSHPANSNQSLGGIVKYLIVRPTINQTKTEEDPDSVMKFNGTHVAHLHNDARQSSLFGGFPSGGFGNGFGNGFGSGFGNGFGNGFGSSNPFGGGGLLRPPAFPTLPPFGPFGQQPPRQPKASIIGNSGGAMALTNDNVVVVNVLSGNY